MSGHKGSMEEAAHRTDAIEGSSEYRRLYEAHYPEVLAFCTRRVGRVDAPDLAAEVFTVAWRRFGSVPRGDRLLPWLYGVANNVISHHRRGRGRMRRLTSKVAATKPRPVLNPDTHLVQREEYDLVINAVSHLRHKDREILLLSVWEELSHEQVAVALGMTEAAVRQRFHRAKRALRKEFDRIGGTLPPPVVAQEGGEQ